MCPAIPSSAWSCLLSKQSRMQNWCAGGGHGCGSTTPAHRYSIGISFPKGANVSISFLFHTISGQPVSLLYFSLANEAEASSNYIVEIEKAQSTNFCNKGEFSQLMVIYLTNSIFLLQNSLNLCCFSEMILFSSHIYDDQVWREKSQLKSHIVFLTKLERFLYRQKLYTISPPNIWG